MASAKTKKIVRALLEQADIRISGNRPWDIQLEDRRMFNRLLQSPHMGLRESYMDGFRE